MTDKEFIEAVGDIAFGEGMFIRYGYTFEQVINQLTYHASSSFFAEILVESMHELTGE